MCVVCVRCYSPSGTRDYIRFIKPDSLHSQVLIPTHLVDELVNIPKQDNVTRLLRPPRDRHFVFCVQATRTWSPELRLGFETLSSAWWVSGGGRRQHGEGSTDVMFLTPKEMESVKLVAFIKLRVVAVLISVTVAFEPMAPGLRAVRDPGFYNILSSATYYWPTRKERWTAVGWDMHRLSKWEN